MCQENHLPGLLKGRLLHQANWREEGFLVLDLSSVGTTRTETFLSVSRPRTCKEERHMGTNSRGRSSSLVRTSCNFCWASKWHHCSLLYAAKAFLAPASASSALKSLLGFAVAITVLESTAKNKVCFFPQKPHLKHRNTPVCKTNKLIPKVDLLRPFELQLWNYAGNTFLLLLSKYYNSHINQYFKKVETRVRTIK